MADFLIDTGVLLRCLRGIEDTIEMMRALIQQGDLHISALSFLEVLSESHPKEEKRTLEFLAPFLHVALNDDIAERAARLARPAPDATPLSFPEAIIAATAVRHGLTLVTYSEAQFEHVPEIKMFTRT